MKSNHEPEFFYPKSMDPSYREMHYWEMHFRDACKEGDLRKVKALTQQRYQGVSPEQVTKEEGFFAACWNGYPEIVEYLTTSMELKAAGHTLSIFMRRMNMVL